MTIPNPLTLPRTLDPAQNGLQRGLPLISPSHPCPSPFPLATTAAGNLGLFMGFSIMTIIEWIEMLAFLALGSLWLILR